jgi:hypothetical protein
VAKLYESFLGEAKENLHKFQKLHRDCTNNFDGVQNMKASEEEMQSACFENNSEREQFAEVVRSSDEFIISSVSDLVQASERERVLEGSHKDLNKSMSIIETDLVSSEYSNVVNYDLRSLPTGLDMKKWIEGVDGTPRAPAALPLAFYEKPEWQEELNRIDVSLALVDRALKKTEKVLATRTDVDKVNKNTKDKRKN